MLQYIKKLITAFFSRRIFFFAEEVCSIVFLSFMFIIFMVHLSSLAQQRAEQIKPNHQLKVVLYYAIMAYGESPETQVLFKEKIRTYSQNLLNTTVTDYSAASFKDYMQKYYGDWSLIGRPELDQTWLSSDSALAPLHTYISSSSRVEKQIQRDQVSQTQFLQNLIWQNLDQVALLTPGLLLTDSSQFAKTQFIEHFVTTIHQQMDTQLSTLHESSHKALESLHHIEGQNKNEQILLLLIKELFASYFEQLPLTTKKAIAFQMIVEGSPLSTQRKLEILIMHSGPQMQKLLQVVAQQSGFPEDLQKLFKKLESQARALPGWYVKKIIQDAKFDFEILNLELKPLGVGTMAQVHRAKIKTREGAIKNVVIRFLKPGIAEAVEHDHRILQNIASKVDQNPEFINLGAPQLSPLVEDISNTVRDELNLQRTILQQIEAQKAYEKTEIVEINNSKYTLHFQVPEIIAAPEPFVVQSMAHGQKIDKEALAWTDTMPELKKVVIENIANLWVEELLFKGGLYHSDLHQGNFLVQVTDPEIRVSILDFGMGGKINSEMQKTLIRLGAALSIQNPEAIGEFLWHLTINTEEKSKSEFKQQVLIRMNELRASKDQRKLESVAEWLTWTINKGYQLNYHMINLNRGLLILERLLAESKSSKNITSIARHIGSKYPKKVGEVIFQSPHLPTTELLKNGFRMLVTKGFPSIFNSSAVKESAPSAVSLKCEALFN